MLSAAPGDNRELFTQGKGKFVREAETLYKLNGEDNIVSVRDYFTENDTAYIVMEYLDGESLQQLLNENGKLSFKEAFELLSPIMKALEKIHAHGLIHRDISPSNIMRLKDGSLKLLDFGAARNMSLQGEQSLSVVVKPSFAPEEQYRTHGEQGPWTDVYALCATMYKLITAQTPENALNRAFQDTLKTPGSLGADITAQQEAVLLKGMAVRYTDRIQNMSELYEAMAETFNVNGSKKSGKSRKKKGSSKGTTVFVLLLIAAAAVYFFCGDMIAKLLSWRSLEPGDTLSYGYYEQNGDVSATEEIEWLVLSREDDRILVTSLSILDCLPYESHENYKANGNEISWESSSLRSWLNTEFINTAFSGFERLLILPQVNYSPGSTEGSLDKIFCLSEHEARELFANSGIDRDTASSLYAESMGCHGCWWLRTDTNSFGSCSYVSADGDFGSGNGNLDYVGVRPVMWLSAIG